MTKPKIWANPSSSSAAAAVKRPAAPTWSKVLPARRPPSASRFSADTAPRAKFNACATSCAPTALTAWPVWAAARPSTRPRPRPITKACPCWSFPRSAPRTRPAPGFRSSTRMTARSANTFSIRKIPTWFWWIQLSSPTRRSNSWWRAWATPWAPISKPGCAPEPKPPAWKTAASPVRPWPSAASATKPCWKTAHGQGRRGAASAHPGCGGDH